MRWQSVEGAEPKARAKSYAFSKADKEVFALLMSRENKTELVQIFKENCRHAANDVDDRLRWVALANRIKSQNNFLWREDCGRLPIPLKTSDELARDTTLIKMILFQSRRIIPIVQGKSLVWLKPTYMMAIFAADKSNRNPWKRGTEWEYTVKYVICR